jgi:hypothetical protein
VPRWGHRLRAGGPEDGRMPTVVYDPRKPENDKMRTLAGGSVEWARQDSNLGPTDYESAALTN